MTISSKIHQHGGCTKGLELLSRSFAGNNIFIKSKTVISSFTRRCIPRKFLSLSLGLNFKLQVWLAVISKETTKGRGTHFSMKFKSWA